MTVVLGIDLGLSSARAAVLDADGRLLGRGRAAQPGLDRQATRRERDVDDWTAAVTAAVRAACAEAGSPPIAAIGVGALGPCPVLLDAGLKPLARAPLFSLDANAEAERRRLVDRHGLDDTRLGPDHVIPRLMLWRNSRPETMAKADVVVDAAGYLVAWLSGRPVMDPITAADHRCEGLAQPVRLPDILPADSIAGGLTVEAAARLGLGRGTPVVTGTYDSHADLAGAGVMAPGDGGLLLGSTMILGAVAGADFDTGPAPGVGLRATRHLGTGTFVGGWTSTSGSLVDWSGTAFADASESGDKPPLPGASGLVALPYFAGERAPVWDPHARGALLGMTLATTPGELRAALIDAVALSALDLAERLARIGLRPDTLNAAGGGWRNKALARAVVDALGLPIDVMDHAGEAVGPAALAFRALGLAHAPRVAYRLVPDARRHASFRALYEIYARLYPALSDSLRELGRLAANEGAA